MVIGTLNTDSTKICHTAEKDKVINLKCRRWMSTRGVTCAHAHKTSHIGHIFFRVFINTNHILWGQTKKMEQMQ